MSIAAAGQKLKSESVWISCKTKT